jgi:alpha-D-ribose 1-methylphosphonate 5-triphosphate synthase subunit PhnG
MTKTDKIDNDARRRWMAVLARANIAEMEALLAMAQPIPSHTRLRGPDAGLVMLRGRAGATGAPFNLGEMTVTRCTVRNTSGRVGHATITGRDLRRAELAAAIDAALQDPMQRTSLANAVITPLAERQASLRDSQARKAAATRVEFFTMATMRT